jgi:hypothetical protein
MKENKKTLLWLDDWRNPWDEEIDWMVFSPIGRDVDIVWVKTYKEFTEWITNNGLPDAICFDHDLGKLTEVEMRKLGYSKKEAREKKNMELSGYDCAKWLVDYCMNKNIDIPDFNIQSSNGAGKLNIESYLNNYRKIYRGEK